MATRQLTSELKAALQPNSLHRDVAYDYRIPSGIKDSILLALISDARSKLPAGTVFEIREKLPPEHRLLVDFGTRTLTLDEASKTHGACWFYLPLSEMEQTPIFEGKLGTGKSEAFVSYMLVSRLIA